MRGFLRMDEHWPVLPLMWAVSGYRRQWGQPLDNPTWRLVWCNLLCDRAYFAPRWIAWLYKLLPLIFWWRSPYDTISPYSTTAGGGWIAPAIGGYGWHVGYVRRWMRFDQVRCGGHWVAFIAGQHFVSGEDPPIRSFRGVTLDNEGFQ